MTPRRAMIDIRRIIVPTSLLFILSFLAILFAPTCPVSDERQYLPSECPIDTSCPQFTATTQLDPPILVLTNGLRWEVRSTGDNLTYHHVFSVNAAVLAVLFLLPLAPPILLILTAKGEDKWHRLAFARRLWRGFLWGYGLSMLVLSSYWAWGYVLFYGVMTTSATIDPLLVTLMGTFLLFGIGLAVMMLAVRSRAIWPVRTDGGG